MATEDTKVIISIETVLRNLEHTLRGLTQVEKQLKQVASVKFGGQSATSFDKAVASAQRLQTQQQKLAVQARELANREEKARLTTERLAAARERLARAAERGARAEAKVATPRGAQADAHVREFRLREREARRVAREINRIKQQETREAQRNAREQERIETRLSNHRIKEARRAQQAKAQADRGSGGGGAFFGGSLLGFAGAGAATSAVGVALGLTIFNLTSRLTEGGRAWIDYAAKVQNARIAFTTMLGGVADADAHLRDLQKFALETPFAFDELIEASQRMQALGFSAKEVIPLLRDVGNAVAAFAGGSEELRRVIKALSDVRARGTLQSQEIRQFAEAGISAFRILQEETGKTTVELQDMVEKGQISADFFIKAFQKFSQTHFGDLMEQQSKTFLGALSNIRDVLLQVATKAFEPLFAKITEISVRVQAELQKITDLIGATDVLANAFIELGGFLAEKLVEGMIAKLADTKFQIQLGSGISRLVSNSIRGFGEEFLKLTRELGSGPARVSAFDTLQREQERLSKATKGLATASELAAAKQAELADSQKSASAVAEKQAEIYIDLVQKLSDVSSVSLELATRQSLLRAGVTDLNSGYAELAISLARAADAQRSFNEQQEIEAKRLRDRNQSLREQLEATRDTTRLALAEVQTPDGLSELERFNQTLGAQVDGVLNTARATSVWNDELQGLANALQVTRTALADLDVETADSKTKVEAEKIFKARAEVTRSLFELQRDLQRDLGTAIRGEEITQLQQLSEQVTSLFGLKVRPDAFDPIIELFKSTTTDPAKAIEAVQQILSTVRGDLGPEFDNITQSIVNAFQAAAKLDGELRKAAERTGELNRLTIQLRTEEDRVHDRVLDGTLTERQAREEILLLQREYRDEVLKILEIELALAKVRTGPDAAAQVASIEAQIEATKRLGKVIDEEGRWINRDLFSSIESGFEGIFNSAIDGVDSVKEAFADLGRSILAVINRVAAESLTEELFGDLLKPGATNTTGTIGGFLGRLFGRSPAEATPAVAGEAVGAAGLAGGAALTTAATTAAASLTAGAVSASAALTTGGATAGATLAASLAAAAAGFSAAVIAAGAAFAAAVAAASAASSASSIGSGLAGLGGAATGLFPAVPGGVMRIVEGGFPEAVLTTDPKHANQQLRILREYLHRTKGLFGRIPEFAEGGMITPRQVEANLLGSIQRAPSLSASMPEVALAGSSSRQRNFRAIFVDDNRGVAEWMNSPEGDEVFVAALRRNRSVIKRLN